MNIDTKELEKAVVQQAVDQLVERYTDPDHDIVIQVSQGARELIEKRVNQAVDTEVKRIVDEGLEKIVFQPTNEFGEPKRPAMTLREFVADTTNRCFLEYVDSNGKPTNDSYYKRPENQRVNRIINDVIRETIGNDIRATCVQIQSRIHEHLGNYVKVALEDAVKKLG